MNKEPTEAERAYWDQVGAREKVERRMAVTGAIGMVLILILVVVFMLTPDWPGWW